MYELSTDELQCLISCIRECISDVACLDAWIDALEYDLKNYIGTKPYSAFRGFTTALQKHLNTMRSVCFSKEFLLDL